MCATGLTAASEFAAITWGRKFCATFWIEG
jgi:hypothetical protein